MCTEAFPERCEPVKIAENTYFVCETRDAVQKDVGSASSRPTAEEVGKSRRKLQSRENPR